MDENNVSEAERLRRRRRSVVLTGILLAVVAVSVYVGFIIMMGQRA